MDCSSYCAMPAMGREASPENNSVQYCNSVILYNTVALLFIKTNKKLEKKERSFGLEF